MNNGIVVPYTLLYRALLFLPFEDWCAAVDVVSLGDVRQGGKLIRCSRRFACEPGVPPDRDVASSLAGDRGARRLQCAEGGYRARRQIRAPWGRGGADRVMLCTNSSFVLAWAVVCKSPVRVM